MINEIIEKIKNDKNYSMKNCILDYTKENDKYYLVHFKEKGEYITGKQYFYLVDKKTNKYKMLFIPNEENFNLINTLFF